MANNPLDASVLDAWSAKLAGTRSLTASQYLQQIHDQPGLLRSLLLARRVPEGK